MSKRLTHVVDEARYVPWYALHASTRARREAGETIGEVEVIFRNPADTDPGGCRILFDESTIARCAARGIRSAQEMVGRMITIEAPDDLTDILLAPVRLVDIW